VNNPADTPPQLALKSLLRSTSSTALKLLSSLFSLPLRRNFSFLSDSGFGQMASGGGGGSGSSDMNICSSSSTTGGGGGKSGLGSRFAWGVCCRATCFFLGGSSGTQSSIDIDGPSTMGPRIAVDSEPQLELNNVQKQRLELHIYGLIFKTTYYVKTLPTTC